MQPSSLVLLSLSCYPQAVRATRVPPGHSSDTRVGSFLVLLECHWCGALLVSGETILYAAILPWQWRVCISCRRISYLVKIYNKTNAFAPIPAWTWLSMDGVCSVPWGLKRHWFYAGNDRHWTQKHFFFFETTSFFSCGSQMFIWRSEKCCRRKSFLKVIVMLKYFGSHIPWGKKKKA